MKYARLAVVFATLTPCLIYAQNQQFRDCRTLAMAGNFVGADETLVDGLVCKVGKPKTSAAASATAAGKAAEGSKALLGIIEPEILRSKEKAEANPGGREATPGAAAGSLPSDFAPGDAAESSSFFTNPKQSLGEIARAFRRDAGAPITSKPDQDNLEEKKPGPEEVDRRVMVSETDKAPAKESVTQLLPAVTTEAPSLPQPRAARTNAGTIAAAQEAFRSTPEESAKNEVMAVRQAQPGPVGQESPPGAARNETAMKHETSLPAMDAKSSPAPDVEAPVPAARPASAQRTPTSEPIAASPESGARADAPKPERLSTPLVFATRLPAERGSPTQPQANRMEEDSPFREGQGSNCNKNVSLGSMDKDKLFLAIPDWALQWFEKNQKRFPGICFSDSLMPGAKNYLVVFHMAPPHAPGSESFEKVSSLEEATGGSGTCSFTASYGSTWHYSYEHTVTTTILSVSAEKGAA